MALTAAFALIVAAGAASAQPPDFSTLTPQILPSVVQIAVRAPLRAPGEMAEQPPRDLPAPPQRSERVTGSGLVIDAEGYIVTLAHLVARGGEARVRLDDGTDLPARLIGSDRRSDIALLKIEARGLAPAKLGDPYKLRLAEKVYVMGRAPAGAPVVTDGILSARDAHPENPGSFLQITNALYPGMSGSPLFNQVGEVVGLTVMIRSRTTGASLVFAVPIDHALGVAAELRAKGRVQRGSFGLIIQEMTPDLAHIWGLAAPTGALVNSVQPNMPAARAGIQPADLILSIAGQEVRKSTDLPRIVARLKPGTVVRVEILRSRGMKREEVSVEVADAGD